MLPLTVVDRKAVGMPARACTSYSRFMRWTMISKWSSPISPAGANVERLAPRLDGAAAAPSVRFIGPADIEPPTDWWIAEPELAPHFDRAVDRVQAGPSATRSLASTSPIEFETAALRLAALRICGTVAAAAARSGRSNVALSTWLKRSRLPNSVGCRVEAAFVEKNNLRATRGQHQQTPRTSMLARP